MNVLIVEPMKAPYIKDIGEGLEAMQAVVGGSIEAVYPFEDPVVLVCNEEGKLNGMPLNRALRGENGEIYDILAGTFFVAGLGEEDFTSLSVELAGKFQKRFAAPETFMNLNGKIEAVPIETELEKSAINEVCMKVDQRDRKYISDDTAYVRAALTNLGKYNEGELVYKWISFPISDEDLSRVLKEIGIDGRQYEEYYISDYECEIPGLYEKLGEYENIQELNALAERLDGFSENELDHFKAIVEVFGTDDLEHLINITHNLDCYDFLPDVESDYDLGYYWVEESGCYDSKGMGNLSNYIDYERFGRDVRMDESGDFAQGGYIRETGDTFKIIYDCNENYEKKTKAKQKSRDEGR
jgi:antirestriction protein